MTGNELFLVVIIMQISEKLSWLEVGGRTPLLHQLVTDVVHGQDQLVLQQRLSAFHHRHYPVDLYIDNANERQGDQNKNNGKNFFQSCIFFRPGGISPIPDLFNCKVIQKLKGVPPPAPGRSGYLTKVSQRKGISG